ncbi:CU044_2847 family protein [Nonomuraea sp. NPDC050790]|uniref:CU044_2847 family protein n=1 Tax=Nonomuraea sp. NPDC050790 TaxID=3364371 RepID=UPI0037B8C9E7
MDELSSVATTSALLPNGAEIEVRRKSGGAADVAGSLPDFTAVADTLRGVSESVLDALRKARPDEVTVEFGMNVSAKSGRLSSLLVSADAAADFKITLKWSGAEPEPG